MDDPLSGPVLKIEINFPCVHTKGRIELDIYSSSHVRATFDAFNVGSALFVGEPRIVRQELLRNIDAERAWSLVARPMPRLGVRRISPDNI
ncbi:MAG: hypothetical protein M3N08_08965 [Pseudomonadota bacterium]|nr:hypothetical protein [Pseudomonadota bacterium]